MEDDDFFDDEDLEDDKDKDEELAHVGLPIKPHVARKKLHATMRPLIENQPGTDRRSRGLAPEESPGRSYNLTILSFFCSLP